MKKLFLLLVAIGFSLPIFAQGDNTLYFKKLSTQRGIHPTVKKASIGIYNNFGIRDSIRIYTRSLEKAVLQRKPAGNIKPELVKVALKKYPGNSNKALRSRLKMYGIQGKKSTKRRRLR